MTNDIWVNGSWLPETVSGISVKDLGVLRGWGVFDFFRTYGSVPFMAAEHVARLKKSAAALFLEVPYSDAELLAVGREAIARHYVSGGSDLGLRFVLTAGESNDTITPSGKPTIYLLTDNLHSPAPEKYETGFALQTVSVDRFLAEAKSNMYLPAVVALRAARAVGADDALFVNSGVREATTSNFFLIKNGRVITAAGGILRGVTRNIICDLARELGILEEREILVEELATADEAFLTSTSKEILPVTKIDGHLVGSGSVGSITQQLQIAFHNFVKNKIFSTAQN